MRSSRQILLAGVSSIALALSAPAVMAADLPTKAPPLARAPAPPSPWTWWLEGGAQGLLGDPFVPRLTPPFDARPARWGGDVAGGFDYRFNGFWHISGDFRFGINGPRTTKSFQTGCISTPCPSGSPINGPNSATRRETNWVADFMIGRDVGLGAGNSQIKGGIRVAEIRGTTHGNMTMVTLTTHVTFVRNAYSQTNRFFGAGPRVALDGNSPLNGPWSIDYMFGVAGLFSHHSTNQAVTTVASLGVTCASGCPLGLATSNNTFTFNPDAMLGIAYALSPTAKLSLNYHVDAYLGALRVFNSAGRPYNTDRIYHGPSVRLTVQLP